MPVAAGSKEYRLDGKRIIADPEFKALLGPLSMQEVALLEENLIADGRCRDPIVVWAEENLILDGYNRIEICTLRNILYKIVRVNLPDREAAIKWIIDNQMGKRNLTEFAKDKLLEMRRGRVLEATKEGKSIRTIAKQENVSTATVQRDIEKAGATGVTGAKITGADGKKYPSREERLGLNHTPPPPILPKGERMPGDDTDSERAAAKARQTDPKQGKPKFDWKPFEKHFAKLMLMPDLIGKAYNAENSKEAKALRTELIEWKKTFKTWAQTISKVKPPKDFSEK